MSAVPSEQIIHSVKNGYRQMTSVGGRAWRKLEQADQFGLKLVGAGENLKFHNSIQESQSALCGILISS